MKLSAPEPRENYHENRAAEQIAHEAAKFIVEEAGSQSLITVTRAVLSSHGDRATVFVSVFPEKEARPALSFLARARAAFSEHLKKNTRIKPLPRVDFALDEGEKNRRRLDELSRGPGGIGHG